MTWAFQVKGITEAGEIGKRLTCLRGSKETETGKEQESERNQNGIWGPDCVVLGQIDSKCRRGHWRL